MRVFGVSGRAVGVHESVTVWVGVGVWLCMCAVHVRRVSLAHPGHAPSFVQDLS